MAHPQSEKLDHDTCNELIRLAEMNGAKVEMVEDNEKFEIMQAVGGLLCYKYENISSAQNAEASKY